MANKRPTLTFRLGFALFCHTSEAIAKPPFSFGRDALRRVRGPPKVTAATERGYAGMGGKGGSGSGCPGSPGGKGGSIGNATTPAGGSVWCVSADQLVLSAETVSGYGCGGASQIGAVPITLDFNISFTDQQPTNAADRFDLYKTDSTGLRTFYGTAVEPPVLEGWNFLGYYTAKTGGEQVVGEDGSANRTTALTGLSIYAHWRKIDAVSAKGSLAQGAASRALVASVTTAPEHQDTYCTWYYRKSGTSDWIAFNPSGATRDLLATGDSVEVSVTTLPDGTATYTYVRRDAPTYDEETKTLWANGSALKILRDTRDTSRVVVYWDQTWDGIVPTVRFDQRTFLFQTRRPHTR